METEDRPPGADPPAAAPLEGVRVLDLGRIVAAPVCAFYLASLGASVIRVERPGGDMSWNAPPFVGPDGQRTDTRGPHDLAMSHLRRGRGKRSVVVDFRTDRGRAILDRLIGASDVLVENFRHGVMDELGYGADRLEELNPRLVHCSITGFGHTGPDRNRQSMDLVVQARSGLMAKTGFADGPPVKTGFTAGDQLPGIFAALAAVAALRRRDRSGKGAFIDVAMLDVLSSLVWDEPVDAYAEAGLPARVGNGDPRGAPHNVFRARDGWVAIAVVNQEHWQALAGAMGRPDLATELDTLAKRVAARDRIDAAVEAWTSQHPAERIDRWLVDAGVPASEVRDAITAAGDPAFGARGLMEPLAHASDPTHPSRYLGARLPVAFDDQGTPSLPPAEPLGAGTRAVLGGLLGLTSEELDELTDDGIIVDASPPS